METSLYSGAFYKNSFAMVISRFEDGKLIDVNEGFLKVTGYTRAEVLGRTVGDINLWVNQEDRQKIVKLLAEHDEIVELETAYRTKQGEIRFCLMNVRVFMQDGNKYLMSSVVDINRRRLAELKLDTILHTVMDGFLRVDDAGHFLEVNDTYCQLIGYTREELLKMRVADIDVMESDEQVRSRLNSIGTQGKARFETQLRSKDGSIIDVDISISRLTGQNELFVFLRDITDRRRSEDELRRKMNEMDTVNRITTAMRSIESLGEMLPVLLDETLTSLDLQAGFVILYNQAARQFGSSVARGWFTHFLGSPDGAGMDLVGLALSTGRLVYSEDLAADMRISSTVNREPLTGCGAIVMPIHTFHEVVGFMAIGFRQPDRPTDAQVRLLETLAEIAGNAIHRTRLHEQTRRSLQRMAALLEIFQTITSSLDLRVTLEVILKHTIEQLEVDAAAVLMLSPVTRYLEYTAWNGFKTRRLENIQIRPGTGLAGRAIYSRQPVSSDDLAAKDSPDSYSRLLREEGFVSGYAMSFQYKGQPAGVLEVYQRHAADRSQEDWLDFLTSLAGQVALSVDKINLFESLQRSNIELLLAYDATIQGWSQAMDMRDQDTENHTLRVTQMTIRLAEVLGITHDELVHIRRGALLHDLGKIGIPDKILNKPGPLTQEEWVIMRKHPQFAFDLLANNEFLRPALDIPYSHHEKWDGTGYPQALKGEQIPLAARMFAMVDVWDALRSDRSYRPAWTKARTIDYLREQSGKHFDPRLVPIFLSHLDILLDGA